jgi:hypothetical protein
MRLLVTYLTVLRAHEAKRHGTNVNIEAPTYKPSFSPSPNFLLICLLLKHPPILTLTINHIMSFKTTATISSFGGKLLKLTHSASTVGCEMALNLYLPPNAQDPSHKIPVLFYLAGLTCTGDNGAEKGFFQSRASEKGIAIVYPDTSPRTSCPLPLPLVAPITPTNKNGQIKED